jgi:hypothetical protein
VDSHAAIPYIAKSFEGGKSVVFGRGNDVSCLRRGVEGFVDGEEMKRRWR